MRAVAPKKKSVENTSKMNVAEEAKQFNYF
jgi:hypothetical protein